MIDLATRGRAYLETLVDRPVAVVGLARSGVAAARLLHASGARVSASDTKPLARLSEEARGLARLGVRLVAADADRLYTKWKDAVSRSRQWAWRMPLSVLEKKRLKS